MALACSDCGAMVEQFAEGGGPHNRRCPDCALKPRRSSNPYVRGRE